MTGYLDSTSTPGDAASIATSPAVPRTPTVVKTDVRGPLDFSISAHGGMDAAPFLDAATAERYRITPSGSHGYAVEWFGRSVYFHSRPTAERNWNDAVTWCEQVREMLAADGGAA